MSKSINLFSAATMTPVAGEPGVSQITPGGNPHETAIINAAADNWSRLSAREPFPNMEAALWEHVGRKVTIIVVGENYFGAKLVHAREGSLLEYQGKVAFLPKGNRTRGNVLQSKNVIDIIDGFSGSTAIALAQRVKNRLPILKPLTQERLNELPEAGPNGERPDMCTLCTFGTWQTAEGTASMAIHIANEYDRENDIVDNCLLIPPSVGTSEHGSEYGHNLLRASIGEVVGFQPISFQQALDLTDLDFWDAVGELFPAMAQVPA